MREKVLSVAASLLDTASEAFSNRICNDWDWPSDWSEDERRRAFRLYHEWNGDLDEVDDEEEPLFNDWIAMLFCAAVLRGEIVFKLDPRG